MNTASQPDHPPAAYPARPSGFVTVVAMVLYTGFAIPVSIIAMENMVVVGVLLAAFLAWQWGQIPRLIAGGRRPCPLPR